MKKVYSVIAICLYSIIVFGQTDKEQLALKVSKSDQQNLEKLKDYLWKRKSNVFVDNQLKVTTITEFRFNSEGKIETKMVDAETTVKQKRGLRGVAQKNAAEDKADYIEKALELAIAYTFMSKGELVDFIDKATISEKDGLIEAVGNNVHVQGDKLTVKIDPNSNLFVYKEFSSFLGKDAVDGKLNYEKFSNGTVHGTTTVINMPAQKMRIEGTNQDYTIRVK
jgi:hypothetical protein